MMYVMCLFQSLPHSGEDVGEVDSSIASDSSPLTSPNSDANVSAEISTTFLFLIFLPMSFFVFSELIVIRQFRRTELSSSEPGNQRLGGARRLPSGPRRRPDVATGGRGQVEQSPRASRHRGSC